MRMETELQLDLPREEVARLLAEDAALTELFPSAETEVVERSASRRTTRTRYRALGREGVATFHFVYGRDGNVRFEKVCDGRIWRELKGALTLTSQGKGTRLRLELEGRTRSLVPEFTIRGPMQEQLQEMASALQRRLQKS